MQSLPELIAQATAWHYQDPDHETRDELAGLIAASDEQALRDRFDERLSFGTAGLRGTLGAGPNRMNRVLVAQAAAGLGQFLVERAGDSATVAVGFDGRKNSEIFAKDSAEILAGLGIKVYLFSQMCPTPLLAFAVKHLGLTGGVMVTASHNPPQDNGYKVYLGGVNGGSQIIEPDDKSIAARIAAAAKSQTFASFARGYDFEALGYDLRADYQLATLSLVADSAPGTNLATRFVYTPMHGVGWATAHPLFEAAGLPELIAVESQVEPDASFATVKFPNPEEPGALDEAMRTANLQLAGNRFGLIIANDPDADRLAVAVPDDKAEHGWRRLTGDQLGLILADAMASQALAAGRHGALASSIVSSSALARVASHYGLDYRETLTGFKWISKVPNLIFGFEEALGYCVDPNQVPDKDGLSAALVFANLACNLEAQGKTVEEHLADLGERYGHFATGQISIRVTDLTKIAALMLRLRTNPPAQIAGQNAVFSDLSQSSAESALGALPPTDALHFDLGSDARVIVRPSGTEPKLKCYLQAIGATALDAEEKLADLRAAMTEILA